MGEAIDVRKRVSSTKFWVTVVVLAGLWWAIRWWLSKLTTLVIADHIGEKIFENLAGLTVTTGATLTGVIVGLWFGVNLGQKIAFLRNGK